MSDLAPAELRAALEQTFRWLQRNLSEFSLSNACNAEEKLHLLKPLGELALAMDIVERVQPGRFAARDISHWCWDELGQGEVLVETLTIRPDLIVGATLYACFHRAGLRSPRLDRLIEFLCRSPSALNVELPKWRRLDVEHGFEGLGLSSFPQCAETGTWVAALPEPWTITDDIAYSLTHDIFYLTDFGSKPHRLSNRTADYVFTWLPAWLFLYSRQRNWDLFAELLMVAACINKTERFSNEIRQLIAAQEECGMTPGPANSAKNLLRDDHSPERVSFLKNYHTTLVSLMALALVTRAHPDPDKAGDDGSGSA